MAETRNFGDIIRDELAADPRPAEEVAIEEFNADLAMKVYEARTAAGLTQKQLAHLVGTQQSVISRIESADYYGRSLTLLQRIARALNLKLRVEFYEDEAAQIDQGSAREMVPESKQYAEVVSIGQDFSMRLFARFGGRESSIQETKATL
ncbi:MAG TPA: helix-turn-helix transcriptional regulator [Gemmataceae bacterium]|nr:helix-turn-helix transcriptional regulator [Gemmataceae bacterium]